MTLGGIRCVKCYTRLTGTKWENDASLKGRVLRLSGDQWAATRVVVRIGGSRFYKLLSSRD